MKFALRGNNAVDLGFKQGAEHGERDLKQSEARIIECEAEPELTGLSTRQWPISFAAPNPATRPLAKQALSK